MKEKRRRMLLRAKSVLNHGKRQGIWCFKHFFNDREVFNKLSGYYNREKYRFELKNIEQQEFG